MLPGDEAYNAASRSIEAKINMYLNGNSQAPVEIHTGNYLVDFDVLEEAYTDSDSLFGSITSNELSITLYNDDGIFSPTNEQGPYYGKLKRGVKCHVYTRAEGEDWASLGVFYVTDWKATITGITASVTANDKLYSVFDAPSLALPVVKNDTFFDFYTRVFKALSIEATVDPTLTMPLVMSYNKDNNSTLLTDMSTGAMSLCCCNHAGVPVVKPLTGAQDVRAVLTDNDQIISVEAEFSIIAGYDGAGVVCNVPQESAVKSVLNVTDFVVPNGATTSAYMELSSTPLIRLAYANLKGTTSASITGVKATSRAVSVTTTSSFAEDTLQLEVYGTVVENVATKMGDEGSNMLSIDNIYVQNTEYAERLLQVLTKFVESPLPVLKITVRGNPLLNIGDLLQAKSTRYNLDFTGILIRQQFTYNGALSGEITLLNAALLEV